MSGDLRRDLRLIAALDNARCEAVRDGADTHAIEEIRWLALALAGDDWGMRKVREAGGFQSLGTDALRIIADGFEQKSATAAVFAGKYEKNGGQGYAAICLASAVLYEQAHKAITEHMAAVDAAKTKADSERDVAAQDARVEAKRARATGAPLYFIAATAGLRPGDEVPLAAAVQVRIARYAIMPRPIARWVYTSHDVAEKIALATDTTVYEVRPALPLTRDAYEQCAGACYATAKAIVVQEQPIQRPAGHA